MERRTDLVSANHTSRNDGVCEFQDMLAKVWSYLSGVKYGERHVAQPRRPANHRADRLRWRTQDIGKERVSAEKQNEHGTTVVAAYYYHCIQYRNKLETATSQNRTTGMIQLVSYQLCHPSPQQCENTNTCTVHLLAGFDTPPLLRTSGNRHVGTGTTLQSSTRSRFTLHSRASPVPVLAGPSLSCGAH